MLIDILGTKLDIGPSQILNLVGVVAIFKMATSIGQIFLNDPLAEKKNQWILLLLGVPNNILKNFEEIPSGKASFSRWRLRWLLEA